MPVRLMCDSDTPAALLDTDVVATYADLVHDEQELAALRLRFTGNVVLIDRGLGDPLGRAVIVDIERGARTLTDLPGWFAARDPANLGHLMVYGSQATLNAAEGVLRGRDWWRWFADWGVGLSMPGHPDAAIQFASGNMLGARVDLSLIHNPRWQPWRAR